MTNVPLRCPGCGASVNVCAAVPCTCPSCGAEIGRDVLLRALREEGRRTLYTASSEDTDDVSDAIFDLDEEDTYGWFLRGVAAAKRSDAVSMYGAWGAALEDMTPEVYRTYRQDMVYFAAAAATAFVCDDGVCSEAEDFVFTVADLESEDDERFAVSVIRSMRESGVLFDSDVSLFAVDSAVNLVCSELMVYTDMAFFLGTYEELKALMSQISDSLKDLCGEDADYYLGLIDDRVSPYEALYTILKSDRYPDEQYEAAADYWTENDNSPYLVLLDDAVTLADGLVDASPLQAARDRREIRRLIDRMVDVYVRHS